MYSEKATSFHEISKCYLNLLVVASVKKGFRHIFVAFSTYINCMNRDLCEDTLNLDLSITHYD